MGFMGEQIVEAGGYSASFAPAIGWAVHLGVSLSYALLFGVVVLALPRVGSRRRSR